MKTRTPRCPDCPYTFVAPSKYRWFELPLALVCRRPYRCGCCKNRFLGRFFALDYLKAALQRTGLL